MPSLKSQLDPTDNLPRAREREVELPNLCTPFDHIQLFRRAPGASFSWCCAARMGVVGGVFIFTRPSLHSQPSIKLLPSRRPPLAIDPFAADDAFRTPSPTSQDFNNFALVREIMLEILIGDDYLPRFIEYMIYYQR
mmetsp:Transcript_62115/g.166685  ORF Transcript_62115/g.166685 Transcript_62115/m.166685 type:complete len:137 (+) Transcript_62115:382-792(+)